MQPDITPVQLINGRTAMRGAGFGITLASALALCVGLSACGGGGGSDETPGAPAAPTTPAAPAAPTTPAAPAALSISGTAATGAAVAGRPVEAKCAAGVGTATTAADGSYTLVITGGTLPCALRVTLADGSALHSLATGTGATARANLTPASQLVLAQLSGADPAALYAGFTATTAAAISPAAVQVAVAAVVQVLKDAGVDFSAAGDLLSATLTAANGSTAGNAYDKALDALKVRIPDPAALTALATSVALSSPAAPPTAVSSAPALPAVQLLQTAAATCPALRSGRIRSVTAVPTTTNQPNTGVVTLNAATLTFTDPTGGGGAFVPVSGSPCRFTADAGASEFVVSPAGVVVGSSLENNVKRLRVAFPEQTIPLADLAGDWNNLGNDSGTGGYKLTSATIKVSATGAITGKFCDPPASACVDVTSGPTIRVNSSGGFDLVFADGTADRFFAYRTGGGELMAVGGSLDGTLRLFTRKRTNTLPTLPALAANGWGVTVNNQGVTFPVSEFSNTVLSVDAAKGSFVRSNVVNFTTNVTRLETLTINTPRDGYSTRTGETVKASDGSSSVVGEFVAMGLRGAGLSAVAFPGSNQLNISVVKP